MDGIVFRPAATSVTREVREERERAWELPEVRTVEVERANSGCPEAPQALQAALVQLGFRESEARRRLAAVLARRAGGTLAPGELLTEALRL